MNTKLPSANDLLNVLHRVGRAKIDGWSIHRDADLIWLTNPYGLDCAFVSLSPEGCDTILQWIASDTQEHEWGSL